jgi:hypothetical protein
MSTQSTQSTASESLVVLPSHSLGYVAVVAAVVTGVLHLALALRVMGFSQTLGILFVLNGLGFLGGSALYLSRYWRRGLYLVAAAYAAATIVAFFGFQGLGPGAFYSQGSLNPLAVVAKLAELVVLAVVLYLYAGTGE